MWSIWNDLCWFKFTLNNRWQIQSICIIPLYQNWNSYSHSHTQSRTYTLGFAFMRHSLARMPIYKFMDYSFNLAVVPLCIENKMCWWAVGREWSKRARHSFLFFHDGDIANVAGQTYCSIIYIDACVHVRNGNMLINRKLPEYQHNAFNSAIDFLDFGIARCVCVCVRSVFVSHMEFFGHGMWKYIRS